MSDDHGGRDDQRYGFTPGPRPRPPSLELYPEAQAAVSYIMDTLQEVRDVLAGLVSTEANYSALTDALSRCLECAGAATQGRVPQAAAALAWAMIYADVALGRNLILARAERWEQVRRDCPTAHLEARTWEPFRPHGTTTGTT